MRIHRAVVLLLMIGLGVLSFVLLVSRQFGSGHQSLVAFLVVLVGAVAGGVAFSWKRYFSGSSR